MEISRAGESTGLTGLTQIDSCCAVMGSINVIVDSEEGILTNTLLVSLISPLAFKSNFSCSKGSPSIDRKSSRDKFKSPVTRNCLPMENVILASKKL